MKKNEFGTILTMLLLISGNTAPEPLLSVLCYCVAIVAGITTIISILREEK